MRTTDITHDVPGEYSLIMVFEASQKKGSDWRI